MTCAKKISVLGGDARQIWAARALLAAGYDTAVCEIVENVAGQTLTAVSPEAALKDAFAVLLPVPYTRDGETLFCALKKGPPLKALLPLIPEGAYIFGGMLTGEIQKTAAEKNCRLFDLAESEEYLVRNAVPTAEGAVEIAMRETPCTLFGSELLVLGYGRVADILAHTLSALGAKVTVAARNAGARAWAEASGFRTCDISDKSKFKETLKNKAVIFNSVPAEVLGENELREITDGTLIIELASPPGGVNGKAAESLGQKVITALSLPGKAAPRTAGEIVAGCVMTALESRDALC